jgi:adenosine kinase
MSVLLSGSLAYDYIMDFPDSFKNHIMPDQLHILNVCFVVEKLEKNLGGTAGNIAYTMKILGSDPIILCPLGSDAGEYIEHFKKYKIKDDYIPIIKDKLTSSAHITTDKDDNQVSAFYIGVSNVASDLLVKDIKEDLDLALVSPNDKQAMIGHAKECYELKIPFCFDPGQQITTFNSQELMLLIGQAKFLIGNDYEMKLIQEKTGWDMDELLNHVEIVITTLGSRGSIVRFKDQIIEIGICEATSVEDPTGAGDAYRAGFFSAYLQGHDYKTCGQVGAVSATYAVEHYGTQNHFFTMDEFKNRYEKSFGETISLEL